jgi:dihydrofolate synthase/folylpolyglutamate synthase
MAGRDYHATALPDRGGILFEIDGGRENWPQPNLPGAHQVANAGIVLAVLRQLEKDDYIFDRTAIKEGLTQTRWPARLEHIEKGALLALLPPGSTLWVDGGHNESAGAVLATQAKTWNRQGDLPLTIVVGMMQTKRAEDFLRHVAPHSATIVATEIQDESKCWPAADLAALAGQHGAATVHHAPDLTQALTWVGKQGQATRVLICGSLYLAGQALRLNKAA